MGAVHPAVIPIPSSTPVRAEWSEKVARRVRPLEAYALGGAGLGISEVGDFKVQWSFEYKNGGVYCWSDTVPETLLFERPGITQISACFDQSLNPIVGFTDATGTYFWLLSLITGQREFKEIPGAATPFCQLDDKRAVTRADSDVILSFFRGTQLIALVQRERYEVEHVMATGVSGQITALAPTTGYRLQWRIKET